MTTSRGASIPHPSCTATATGVAMTAPRTVSRGPRSAIKPAGHPHQPGPRRHGARGKPSTSSITKAARTGACATANPWPPGGCPHHHKCVRPHRPATVPRHAGSIQEAIK